MGKGNMKIKNEHGKMKLKFIVIPAVVLLVLYSALAQTNYITTIVNNMSIGDAFEIFVDTTNNLVGIGTSSPSNTLDVVGDVNVSGELWVTNKNLTVDFQRFIGGWDVSTAVFKHDFDASSQAGGGATGLFFKTDGIQMYVVEEGGGTHVIEYNLSTAWDVSTASYNQEKSVGGMPSGIFFKYDGTKMYDIDRDGDDVTEWNLSTAWDVSTASSHQNFDTASQHTNPHSVFFSPNGTNMYLAGHDSGGSEDEVNEYHLSTPWDISTAVFKQLFSVSAQEDAVRGAFFKPDGTKMYVTGESGDDVNEYDLSIPWNVTTASFLRTFGVSAQDTSPNALFFRDDGAKMYITGQQNNDVYEYDVVGELNWTKPSGRTIVMIEIIGGGGGGGGGNGNAGGAGGGGALVGGIYNADDLPATLKISVGAAGSRGAASTDGTAGGNTYVNSTTNFNLTAYGGGGGATAKGGGGGGGTGGPGADGSGTTGGNGGNPVIQGATQGNSLGGGGGKGGNGVSNNAGWGSNAEYGGGGGGAGNGGAIGLSKGGSSIYGAGGGSGGDAGGTAGRWGSYDNGGGAAPAVDGISRNYGAGDGGGGGGVASIPGGNGGSPGGGGGGGASDSSGGAGGAGGRGEVRIWSW